MGKKVAKSPRRVTCVIANPIYDVVFKRLMSDLDTAKGILSVLLAREIVSLRFATIEHVSSQVSGARAKLFRLDFCAVVRNADGQIFQVLIELQKAREMGDDLRFRYYLAIKYSTLEEIETADGPSQEPLPIVPIYLLGYCIAEDWPLAIHIRRQCRDAVASKVIRREKWPEFIERLTHDALIFQLPKIAGPGATELEQLLSVFDQNRQISGDLHRLDYDSKGTKLSPLMRRVLRELKKLQADPEMQQMMTYEDAFRLEQERLQRQWTRDLRRELEEARREKEEARSEKEEEKRRRETAELELERLRKLVENGGS